MRKRLTLILLSIVAATGCAVAAAACGGGKGDDTHTHNMKHIAAVAATCTEAGHSEYWQCTDCNKYYSDKEGKTEIADISSVTIAVDATAHNWGNWQTETNATCTQEGEEKRVCANNSAHTESRPTGMVEHDLTPVEAENATCIAEGNIAYWSCNDCGNYFSDENGNTKIEDKASVVTQKIDHDLAHRNAVEANCVHGGNSEYWECNYCHTYFSDAQGNTIIENKNSVNISVDSNAHDWGVWQTVRKPSCTGKGEEKRVCTRDDAHYEFRPVDMLAHELTNIKAVETSCTKKGNIEYCECSVCENYFSDAQAATKITEKRAL